MKCWTRSISDFAAERWQRFVVKSRSEPVALNRRALEVCVFVHLAAALQAGDVYDEAGARATARQAGWRPVSSIGCRADRAAGTAGFGAWRGLAKAAAGRSCCARPRRFRTARPELRRRLAPRAVA